MDKTKEQIMNATGDDLSRMAGEMLRKVTHCIYCASIEVDWETSSCGNKKSPHYCKTRENKCEPCKFAAGRPIPLTWPEAMKWRD